MDGVGAAEADLWGQDGPQELGSGEGSEGPGRVAWAGDLGAAGWGGGGPGFG